jgi:hypothetical protein
MTDPETAYIDWHYPPPRPGFDGAIDRFIGPGTTPAELILGTIVSVGAALLLLLYALARPLEWNLIQLIVGALLALDIAGGVVTNATSSAKRWYHRAGQGAVNHLAFLAVHILHLLLLVVFFRAGDWGYALGAYGYVMLTAAIVTFSPLYLRRPIAFTGLMGAFVLNAYVLLPTPGFEWFLPAYTLKLLVAHLLREEPYRPLIETGAGAKAAILSKSETSSALSQPPTAAVDVMEIVRSLNGHQLHELRTILAMHDDENDDTVTLERPRDETD